MLYVPYVNADMPGTANMRAEQGGSFETVIVGSGIAGLIAACSLWEQGRRNFAILSSGYGGAPFIAAFNAVLPGNPHGDSPARYCSDMLSAGYCIGDEELVRTLGGQTGQCVELLERWGVSFSKRGDGQYLLRHASGSSCPRSLCRTDMLVGNHIVSVLKRALQEKGTTFFDRAACVGLLTEGRRAAGVTYKREGEPLAFLSAPTVLAAWGGVGNLYKKSTYPGDIDGRTLAMAYQAGASLIDLEFVEFEPMVSLEPLAAVGEPCPTAMLGEGAHLLNSLGERFLLKVRPEGEAGAPKSLINNAIRAEVAAGRGSPLSGVFVDLRHIDQSVLNAYPWFYERQLSAGLDVKSSLLQVGPMAHSHSGGLEIDSSCMTSIDGLFAAGEAAGGMHGACRMAGNAATQAAASGLTAASGIAGFNGAPISIRPQTPPYYEDLQKRAALLPEVRETVSRYIEKEREAAGLRAAIGRLEELRGQASGDTFTEQCALSGLLLAKAARAREESRGTHSRNDFPMQRDDFDCSIRLCNKNGELAIESIPRYM